MDIVKNITCEIKHLSDFKITVKAENTAFKLCSHVFKVGSTYCFTDKEVLRGVVTEEASEHLLQPGHQPALQLLLQAAVLTVLLAAGLTSKRHFWLV